MLGLNPSLDHIILSIQQGQLPSREKLRKEEEAGRNTEEGHERKDNGDGWDIHNTKNTNEENHLEQSVLVDASLLHVLGVDSLRISARLLEEQEESVPEFNSRKRGETHEKEDSIKDWYWQQLQGSQEKHGQSQQKVREEHGQSGFLDIQNVAVAILVSKGAQVNDAWDRGGNQPRKTQQSIDAVEDTRQTKIIIVSFTVFKL